MVRIKKTGANVFTFNAKPTIRVRIATHREAYDFRLTGDAFAHDDSSQHVLSLNPPSRTWRIILESYIPAQFEFTHRIASFRKIQDAERFIESLSDDGLEPSLRSTGGMIQCNGSSLSQKIRHDVCLGAFNSKDDAALYGWNIQEKYGAELLRVKIRGPRGTLELYDEEYSRIARFEQVVHIQGESSPATVKMVGRSRSMDSFEGLSLKTVPHPVSFRIGEEEGIDMIIKTPVEEYVQSVLESHSSAYFPANALKGLAVVMRSWAMSNIGVAHPDTAFDVCSEKHCQDFRIGKQVSEGVERAVASTHGEVLLCGDSLCETPYTAVCGGFSEGGNGFQHDAVPYLTARADGFTRELSLGDEDHLLRWITEKPDVYCNPDRLQKGKGVNGSAHFRWEKVLSRRNLELALQENTSEQIGTVYDIIPVSRSSSGRLKEIEILGSRKNLRIRTGERIRETLSDTPLPSCCFIIDKHVDKQGVPLHFSFHGAGEGSGIGLCLSGAVTMAQEGQTYQKILNQYFHDVILKKFY